ncbi:serine acetyltransferase [Geothrix limicola]|uniref:Serine acetyltransferase n=1 Tax=Geothrix limicola TaxID=2927978 RepID=A0ABQ5QFI1_9BACT|nr:serine O-acetyltransferase [Geothrix limicola]GLH72809.1 serine acetyltransferase [Geothrix limicola]
MARPSPSSPDLHTVVEALAEASTAFADMPLGQREFPSRTALAALMDELRALLFPGYFGTSELKAETLRYHLGAHLDRVVSELSDQIQRGLMASDPCCKDCEERARTVAGAFLARLPEVRRLLGTDIQAGFEGDPAATTPEEVLFSYPGLLAITHQRLAHELLKLGVPLLPRMITEQAHSLTGIDIHPGAEIGERFFIDHGTGVVIGETCIIGRNVRIYQGVTLGAKSFPLDADGHPVKGVPRHPVVEDDVIIYSNATVLGRITLGKGSAIGGNVWLTRSVPPGSIITQANEKDGMPS